LGKNVDLFINKILKIDIIMEKKIYMEPATRVVTAQTTQFLMTSTSGAGVHGGEGYDDIGWGGSSTGNEEIN
jgi:hypothetical protein